MIIIFEGHDKAGKSTIAKEFCQRTGSMYLRDTTLQQAAKENVNQTYARYQLAWLLPALSSDFNIVIDRAIISHFVYAAVYKQPINIALANETFDLMQKSGKVLHVICYKDGPLAEDEIFDKQEQVRAEFMRYAQLPNALMLNTTDQNLEQQLQTITEWIDTKCHHTKI